MKSFEQQVADWARSKPSDETYDYGDFGNCALAQFLRDSGYSDDPRCGGDYWHDNLSSREQSISPRLAYALAGENTFGALAERLSS